MSECRHPYIEHHRNEQHDLTMWSCGDCARRFYPACEKCVSVGHREGHGEHIPARSTPAEALQPLDIDEQAALLDEAIGHADFGEVARTEVMYSAVRALHENNVEIAARTDGSTPAEARASAPLDVETLLERVTQLSHDLQTVHADDMQAAGIPTTTLRSARMLALDIRDRLTTTDEGAPTDD